MERQIPTVSIDRSLAHYLSFLDLDLDRIADYYDQLPFPDKPSLGTCKIHVSSLLVQRGTRAVAGVVAYGDDVCDYDPLAPANADILIFVGSINAIGITLADAIGHELVHFASPTKVTKKSPEVMAMEQQVWFYRSGLQAVYSFGVRLILLSAAWVVFGLTTTRGLRLFDWLVCLAATMVMTAITSPRRHRRTVQLETRLHEIYLALEGEQTAFGLSDLPQEACKVTMRPKPRKAISRPGVGHRRQDQIADAAHRQACLRPPRKLRATIYEYSENSSAEFHALPHGRRTISAHVSGRI